MPQSVLAAIEAQMLNNSSNVNAPLWTATNTTNAHIISRMKAIKTPANWSTDYLKAAQAAGDHPAAYHIRSLVLTEANLSINLETSPVHSQKKTETGTLRQRKVSKRDGKAGALDGADESSIGKQRDGSLRLSKQRDANPDSSYTLNSQGGFHNPSDSGYSGSLRDMIIFTPEDIADLANTSSSDCAGNPHSPVRTASLPVPKGKDDLVPVGVGHTLRRVTAMPILPSLRRVTSFSRENYSSYEKMKDSEGQKEETKPSEKPAAVDGGDKQDSAQPDVSMAGQTDGANEENGLLMLTPSDLSTVPDPAEISRRLAERAKPGMDIEDLFDGPFESCRERTIRTSDSIISLSSWYGEMEERYITPFYEANTVSPASIQNENRKPRTSIGDVAPSKKCGQSRMMDPHRSFLI